MDATVPRNAKITLLRCVMLIQLWACYPTSYRDLNYTGSGYLYNKLKYCFFKSVVGLNSLSSISLFSFSSSSSSLFMSEIVEIEAVLGCVLHT